METSIWFPSDLPFTPVARTGMLDLWRLVLHFHSLLDPWVEGHFPLPNVVPQNGGDFSGSILMGRVLVKNRTDGEFTTHFNLEHHGKIMGK